jgi:hypothetical protein
MYPRTFGFHKNGEFLGHMNNYKLLVEKDPNSMVFIKFQSKEAPYRPSKLNILLVFAIPKRKETPTNGTVHDTSCNWRKRWSSHEASPSKAAAPAWDVSPRLSWRRCGLWREKT